MKHEPFEGHASAMKKPSPWLASEDLLDRGDVEVTIAGCEKFTDVEFDAGRKEQVIYALCFEKTEKRLVLNSTNRKTLVNKFGANVQKWKGQKVTLWVDESVRMMGKRTRGIRIK